MVFTFYYYGDKLASLTVILAPPPQTMGNRVVSKALKKLPLEIASKGASSEPLL